MPFNSIDLLFHIMTKQLYTFPAKMKKFRKAVREALHAFFSQPLNIGERLSPAQVFCTCGSSWEATECAGSFSASLLPSFDELWRWRHGFYSVLLLQEGHLIWQFFHPAVCAVWKIAAHTYNWLFSSTTGRFVAQWTKTQYLLRKIFFSPLISPLCSKLLDSGRHSSDTKFVRNPLDYVIVNQLKIIDHQAWINFSMRCTFNSYSVFNVICRKLFMAIQLFCNYRVTGKLHNLIITNQQSLISLYCSLMHSSNYNK